MSAKRRTLRVSLRQILQPLFLLPLLFMPVQAADPDALTIMRKSAAKDMDDLRRLDNFVFEIHSTEKKLDKEGNVRKTETKVEEVLMLDGTPYEKLLSEDGKALAADKARKEQEKLDKELAKRRNESERDRAKRLAEEAKERKERNELRKEIVEAFNFEILGQESVAGAACWKIQALPKAEYLGRTRMGKNLPKMKGILWVEQTSYRWLRVEAELIDKITFGGFLASVAPGSKFQLVQQQVQEGLWAIQQVDVRFAARALFLNMREQASFRFQNFRKYSSDSTITVLGEVVESGK